MSNESPPQLPVPTPGVAQPGLLPGDEDRMLGMLAHLLAILSGFVGPMYIGE